MFRRAEDRKASIDELRQQPSARQLAKPLDYIVAEHHRQRALCDSLDVLSQEEVCDQELAKVCLDFLQTDFGLHIIDEEEDLFPLLRRRCGPEDDIQGILGDLSEEHAVEKKCVERIISGLEYAIGTEGSKCFVSEFKTQLGSFSAKERRHLVVENAIVIPFARKGMTEEDLQNLGRRMAARRGLDYPDTDHAL